MKNLYMNQKSWPTLFKVCLAFVLLLGTSANAQTTFGPFTDSPALAIPDNAYDGSLGSMAATPITVSGVTGTSVVDIFVELAIDHTWVGDLIIKLQSPDGDILTLTSSPGGAEAADDGTSCAGDGDNLVSTSPITFSDAGVTDGENLGLAGGNICEIDGLCSYFPSPGATVESATSFADFFGTNMNGDWTLYLGDDCGGDAGTIQSWSITIVTASPTIEVYKTVALEDGDGDCSNDAEPPLFQSSLEVNSGDDVCYFYTAFNTGDVAFGLHDVTDDILGPLATELAFNLDTAAGVYLAIGPVNITENVVNTVTWTAYNAGPTDETTATATAVVTLVGSAPTNDNVCDAIALEPGIYLNPGGNSANATAETGEPVPPQGTGGGFDPGCESTDGWCSGNLAIENSVWFTFVAPASGSVTINTDGSYDTQIAVYEAAGCASILSGGATLLAANDDNPNYQFTQFSSLLDVNCLIPGQTYYLQVDGYEGSFGDLYVELIENPGEAVSATVSGGGIACDGGTSDVQIDLTGVGPWDVVVLVDGANPSTQTGVATSPLVLTVSNAGTYTIESVTDANGCTAVGQGSAVVTLGTSPTASFTSFQDPAGLDVDFTDASSESPTSWAWDFGDGNTSISQNPTHTYAASGTYTVCLTATNDCGSSTQVCEQVVVAQPVVDNDLCSTATDIECGETLAGDFTFASADNSDVTCAADGSTPGVGQGVWYHYVGTGQDVTASTCGSNADTEVTVYSGDCNSLACVGNNDDDCGLQSTVNFYAEPGTDYYINVARWTPNSTTTIGDFSLSLTCVCPSGLDAGTLTADATPVCLTGGTATISATEGTAPTVPAGYEVAYVLTDGDSPNLDILDVVLPPAAVASFDVTAGGNYIIHTLVFDPADGATILGETTGVGVATLIGTGAICASLDVAGTGLITVNAPDAGTLTADATPVCLTGGTATISATVGTAPTVPAGYEVAYVLTDGDSPNLDILDVVLPPAAVASFDVTAEGNYIIHTLVFDPADGATILGETTGVGVATLIGTGAICASLDVTGAQISVDGVCPPANDECAGAEVLTQGAACSPTAGTLEAATTGGLTTCSGSTFDDDVWYAFVATANSAIVSVDASDDIDAVVEVFEGACGSLTQLADGCIDDGFSAGIDEEGTVTGLTIGNTYYIRIYNWTTSGTAPADATFDICVFDVPPPPANDVACSATALSLGANGPFDHSGYTSTGWETTFEAPAAASCEDQGGWCLFELEIQNSAYYTFVAPGSGNVSVSADGSSFDTQIAVLFGSCQDVEGGTAVIVGANDDDPNASGSGGSDFTSNVLLCGLTGGETYYVLVDGYTGAEGDLVLTITEIGPSADFTSSATNLNVDFTDASTGAVSWDWDFGDGNSSTDQNPSNTYAASGPYTVCLTVTDDLGCTDEYCEAIQVTDIPTSIADAVENGMEVYPNPSNGEFVVEIRGVEADVQLNVLDLAGRVVYTEGAVLNGDFRRSMNLDVATGTYLLQIATEEGLVTRKIQIH